LQGMPSGERAFNPFSLLRTPEKQNA